MCRQKLCDGQGFDAARQTGMGQIQQQRQGKEKLASSELTLRLFGALEASIDDKPLTGLHLREGERLLAYLALRHGQLVTYRQLALLFWPSEAQQNDEYAGGDFPSTRQGVRALRRALGDHEWRVESAGRGVIRFNLDDANVDLLRFEQLAQSEINAAGWREALQLCSAPLLDGWRETWAVEARARCQRSHARITALLASLPAPEGDKEIGRQGEEEKIQDTRYKIQEGEASSFILHPSSFPLDADGGAVPLNSPFYILHDTDANFAQAITRQDSIVLVKGARQVGKTSLLARGLQTARQNGSRVVMTDFDSLSQTTLGSSDALYRELAQEMADQLALDTDPEAHWNPNRSANRNLERFLCNVALAASDTPLVWGLDEVDRLFTLPCGNEVFGLFRSWHNRRALDPDGPWSRLTLAIAYATEAHLFIQDLNQSPFNVGTRLQLDDFTPDQLADLNRRYGSPLSEWEVSRFYDLIGGHPYLARRGYDTMVTRQLPLDALEAEADQENGPFGEHLRRMLAALSRAPELKEAVRALSLGQRCATPETFYRLRAAGVLTGASLEEARFRCRLYAIFLARHLR